MKETFKPIPFAPNYEAGSLGSIRSKGVDYINAGGRRTRTRPRIMRPSLNRKTGYLVVAIRVDKVQKTYAVHRAVAAAWHPNPAGLPEVNHKDGNKQNNREDNLEWCTKSYNHKHRFVALGHKNTGGVQPNRKRVAQVDLTGHRLGVFDSIAHAARETGVPRLAITNVLNGRNKTGAGFRWEAV